MLCIVHRIYIHWRDRLIKIPVYGFYASSIMKPNASHSQTIFQMFEGITYRQNVCICVCVFLKHGYFTSLNMVVVLLKRAHILKTNFSQSQPIIYSQFDCNGMENVCHLLPFFESIRTFDSIRLRLKNISVESKITVYIRHIRILGHV